MKSLRIKTTKALFWDLVGNYGGQFSSFIISIFLARLLEPEEFGLVGMSMVFIAILQIFKDMGFASALIQNKENTSLTYSSVFYLNVFAGALLTIMLYLAAPSIGDFYENHKITELVRLLSIIFFISSFTIVQTTILRRELDFKSLTFRDLISQVVAGIIAIIFAWNGFGVYALVIQQIIAALISVILLWKISNWYPKIEFSWIEVKKLSSYSVYVFAARFINQIINQIDTLIVGKLFSPATLGYYSRGNSLNNIINKNSISSLSKVFFPALSAIQDKDERFEKVFLNVIKIVSVLSAFITGVFYIVGEVLIIQLFGAKWEPSVFIFKILIIKGFTYPISAMIVSAFLAKGKSKENFHYGNIRKGLQLTPMIFAFYFGFNAFLYATVIVSVVAWFLNNIFVHLSLNISFIKQLKAVLPNICVVVILVLSVEYVIDLEFNLISVFVKLIIFTTIYLIYLKVTGNIVLSELYTFYNKFKLKMMNK